MDGTQSPTQHELTKPQIAIGEVGHGFGKESFGSVTPELKVAPMPGERLSEANNAVSQALTVVPAMPIQQSQFGDDTTVPSTTNPALADDSDVIEKEWVDKAKEIVARTQGDPHAKSNELTGLKKEYIQKRYGKSITTPSDEVAKA